MSQMVKKRVTISMCFGQQLVDGHFETFSAPVYRAVTPEKATSYFRKELGDSSITISHVESDTATYEMPLAEFLKYAVTYDSEIGDN